MITTTTALDPTLVNLILTGLLERETPLDALAADVGMDLDELLQFLEHPDMQAKVQRLQRVLDQRTALLTAAAESTAIGALTALMEQARNDQTAREQLRAEQHAAKPEDTAHAARIENGLTELDRRFKKLTEAARSARATLAHSRTVRRTTPRGEAGHPATFSRAAPAPSPAA